MPLLLTAHCQASPINTPVKEAGPHQDHLCLMNDEHYLCWLPNHPHRDSSCFQVAETQPTAGSLCLNHLKNKLNYRNINAK